MDINYDNFVQRFKEKELTEAKDTDRYILYAVNKNKYGSRSGESERAVAEFSSKKLAYDYLKKATLKKKSIPWGESPFKKNSLLHLADSAYIEVKDDDDLPLNPTI